MQWTVIVPMKDLGDAKTRLLPADDPSRPEFAASFLQDALAAIVLAQRVQRVIVVTNDDRVRRLVDDSSAEWLAESDARGLNAAALHGLSAVHPDDAAAVMAGDLPCLTPQAVDLVLDLAEGYPRSFVSDAPGVGTTMLLARRSPDCLPTFGTRSRAVHAMLGNVEIGLDPAPGQSTLLARARRDVDTPVDLWDAVRLGVGPATERVLSWNAAP